MGCRTNKLVGSPFCTKNKNAVPQDHALGVNYKYAQTKYIVIINGVIVVFKNKSTNFYGCK